MVAQDCGPKSRGAVIVKPPRTLCALLAGGLARRFGGNKLEAMLGGEMLGTYAAQALIDARVGDLLAVTRADTHLIADWLCKNGFTLLTNHDPERGLSSSIAMAAAAAQARQYDALMIVLGDMPLVPVDHLRRLADRFVHHRIASTRGDVAMPPAIFPASDFAALMALTGESGAGGLLRRADTVHAKFNHMIDIDTVADLAIACTQFTPK